MTRHTHIGACALLLLGVVLPVATSAARNKRQRVIETTMPATVMVLAVEIIGDSLNPVASGSGTIISADGSVLTNHHVLSKPTGGMHDLFIISRFRAADREPEMVCAGHPSRGRLRPELDLALIKCDTDMTGQPWTSGIWPTIPVGRSEDVSLGEQLWVLGYPNVGGTTINVTAGLVSGWTGEEGGTSSRAYMKTDAAITHGNSGGTAVDEDGKFIGVPTAFRVTTAQQGMTVATVGKVGLIRPIEHARDLLSIANAGWSPSADVEPPPSREPGPAEPGVIVTSTVVDASNHRPIEGAVVVVFQSGLSTAELDSDNLESQAIAWGQTNAGGMFAFEQKIPRGGRHAIAVIAEQYHPLVVDDALAVGTDAPDLFDPWNQIQLRRE